MLYRDFMQTYRPLLAPPDVPGSAPTGEVAGAAASASPADAGATAAAGATGAAPAEAAQVSGPAAEVTPAAVAAPAAPEAPKSEPSLLEAADGKKPDAAAKVDGEGKTDSPAPAEPANADGAEVPEAKDAKKDGEGEKKPDAEASKDAGKTDPEKKDATAEPPAPIKYDAFKLPDGIKFDDERLGKFTEVAGKAQIPQDVAQSLVSLHVEEMARVQKDIEKAYDTHQRDVWRSLNDTWKADFRKDPELGGNRAETSLAMAKAVIEEFGGTPDQVREYIAHISNNGMGNFIGHIRLLANIGETLNIFETSEAPANPAAPKMSRSRGERWYPSMGNGNGATR